MVLRKSQTHLIMHISKQKREKPNPFIPIRIAYFLGFRIPEDSRMSPASVKMAGICIENTNVIISVGGYMVCWDG